MPLLKLEFVSILDKNICKASLWGLNGRKPKARGYFRPHYSRQHYADHCWGEFKYSGVAHYAGYYCFGYYGAYELVGCLYGKYHAQEYGNDKYYGQRTDTYIVALLHKLFPVYLQVLRFCESLLHHKDQPSEVFEKALHTCCKCREIVVSSKL